MDRNKELKVHRLRLPGRSLCSIRSNRKWCKRRGSSLQCQNCFFVYPIIDCNLKNLVNHLYIQKWCKIIICRIGTVNSVIYCNKTDIFLREHHFRIETYLQIVSAKSGHIFDDHCSHSAGFNLCQQRIECRSVER